VHGDLAVDLSPRRSANESGDSFGPAPPRCFRSSRSARPETQPRALAERVDAAIVCQRQCVLGMHRRSHHADALKPLDELGPVPVACIPVTKVAMSIVTPRVERTSIGHGA
jgi:hypothetical protein